MTADLVQALRAAKFASREVYGIRRTEAKENELLRLLNAQMILQVLSASSCLEELTSDEQDLLSNTLIMHS